jgi:Tol biopolymer transport system component
MRRPGLARRTPGPAVLALALAALIVTAPASATIIRERTIAMTLAAKGGASAEQAVSASGRVVAFSSTSSDVGRPDPNGSTRDVYAVDLVSHAVRLASAAVDESGANGPSSAPALSDDGRSVAFASSASNLIFGDTNGVDDVFLREGPGAVRRVSIATDGGQANGPSGQPSISADGRYIAFTSAATNLAPGAGGPGTQIYLRDLLKQTTVRVSDAADGAAADGVANGPAISGDGRALSFDSAATNLVVGDTNGLPDVFVRTLSTRAVERVSVATDGAQQDKAVTAPFAQVSSVSGDGRFVAFDSDAANLVRGDANQRTDVFVRDRLRKRTMLVSENNAGFEGNNDSFAPTISADGGHVAFESFSTNLSSGGGPRENVFVRDLGLQLTSVVNVGSHGGRPGAEQVKQLLQRPALSATGRIVAFTSTTRRLTRSTSGRSAVFARRMNAPRGKVTRSPPRTTTLLRPFVGLAADEPQATRFSCRIDGGPAFTCRRGVQRLPRQVPGAHVLEVRAGGPGLLYDPVPVTRSFSVLG